MSDPIHRKGLPFGLFTPRIGLAVYGSLVPSIAAAKIRLTETEPSRNGAWKN